MCKRRVIFTKLKDSLVNTRKKIGDSLFALFHGVKKIDGPLLNELEEKLLIADVGYHTTKKIIDRLVNRCNVTNVQNFDSFVYGMLREEMSRILSFIDHSLNVLENKKPFVILVVGVNGVGKTSLVAKLAYWYRNNGKSVLIGAADTFRAAAVDQLRILGMQSGVPVIGESSCSDSASVVFDAMKSAENRYVDILIIDTAGRLQNKSYLMNELKKIIRVIKKFDVHAPHEVMIVLDSSIGQNSIHQVDLFNEYVGVTGITMSKLDGTSKGGVVFSIVDQFNIPIRYVSFGKNISDLCFFNVDDYVSSLFE